MCNYLNKKLKFKGYIYIRKIRKTVKRAILQKRGKQNDSHIIHTLKVYVSV